MCCLLLLVDTVGSRGRNYTCMGEINKKNKKKIKYKNDTIDNRFDNKQEKNVLPRELF